MFVDILIAKNIKIVLNGMTEWIVLGGYHLTLCTGHPGTQTEWWSSVQLNRLGSPMTFFYATKIKNQEGYGNFNNTNMISLHTEKS